MEGSFLWVFLVGLLVGSFVNVCIYRIPRKESLLWPASHCPLCKTPIAYYDNIPVISFLVRRGRCRACGGAISWQYPLVECIHASGYLAIVYRFGFSIEALIYTLFFSSLLVLSVIDLYHQILPNVITLPGMVLGFIAGATLLPLGPVRSALGLATGGGFLYLIALLAVILLKKEGMGGGDVKLAAYMGTLLGWQKILLSLFLASFLGALIGCSLIAIGIRRRSDPIPFGPFLAAGGLIALFFGEAIYQGYFYASSGMITHP